MKIYQFLFLINFLIGISCTNKNTKVMTGSDWKEKKIINVFKKENVSIVNVDTQVFEEERIINTPFYKYKINLDNGVSMYLIGIEYSTASEAVKKATEISNTFRKIDNSYVSSGVNGNILVLIVSSQENNTDNDYVFNVLKNM